VRGHEGFAVRFLMSPPAGFAPLYTGVGDSGGFRTTDVTQYPDAAAGWLNGTGDVNMIDYCNSDPGVMYRVGMTRTPQTGGMMKSTDYGVTWIDVNVTLPAGIALSDGVTTMVGGRVAVSDTGPNRIVWLPYKVGLPYTSGDGGQTWTACGGVPAVVNTNSWIQNSYLPDRQPLASGKDGSNHMYYATSGNANIAFYTSSDGGLSFMNTGAGLPGVKTSNWMVRAVPDQAGGVWLSLDTNGLYASTDSGADFSKLSNVASCAAFGFGKSGSGAPACVYMIGTLAGDPDPQNKIFRSDDMGQTWVRLNDDQHPFGTAVYIIGDEQVYGRVFIGTSGRGVAYGIPQKG